MRYLSLKQGAAKALRLTQQMLLSAEQADWQTVASLEAERQRSIESLFGHPELPFALAELADSLRQIIELDKRCLILGEAACARYAEQLPPSSTSNRQAVNAYLAYS